MRKKPKWMAAKSSRLHFLLIIAFAVCQAGCSQISQWRDNGFKVGPNYTQPTAPVSESFSQNDSPLIQNDRVLDPQWWRAFNDQGLNDLVDRVYRENLNLKQATWRIEEARALLAAQKVSLLPQQSQKTGAFSRNQNIIGFPGTSNQWSRITQSAWELDFWGKFRRGIDAAEAQHSGAIKDYDFALISLIGDVASLYIQIRSLEERIELAKLNVKAFEGSLEIAEARAEEEVASPLDVAQAESNLYLVQALIPQLEFARQQSLKALAVLLAVPPSEIDSLGGEQTGLPEIPLNIVVGVPADLLARRPDIQSAERNLKAAFEQIGITHADLYPSFSISGNLGYASAEFKDLFKSSSFTGSVGPSFSWNVLNFGRIRNQIRANEARFNQLKFQFENLVLAAQQEVETSMIEFIKTKEEYEFNMLNEKSTAEAARIVLEQFKAGDVDFGRVFVVQSNLVQAQDTLVANRAEIAIALINTYRALGGGWEIRCDNFDAVGKSPETLQRDSIEGVLAKPASAQQEANHRIGHPLFNAGLHYSFDD